MCQPRRFGRVFFWFLIVDLADHLEATHGVGSGVRDGFNGETLLGETAGVKKADVAIGNLFPDEWFLECVN